MEQIIYLDGQLLIWFQNFLRHPILDRFFIFYTSLGDIGLLWIVLGLVFLAFRKTRRTGLLLLLALALSHLFNTVILKNLIERPRPYTVLQQVESVIGPVSQTSFPSGHSATAFASAMIPFLREKGFLRWVPLILAILMGLSRVYVGVHYPIDVLAGAVVGSLTAYSVFWIDRRLTRTKIQQQSRA